jgi:hypothetical protein
MLTGLCLLAALVTSAVCVATASAEEPLFKVGEIAHEVATRHILAPSEKRSVTVKSLPSKIILPALNLTIACSGGTGRGEIHNSEVENLKTKIKQIIGYLENAELLYEGCEVIGSPACYVNGAIGGSGKIAVTALTGKLGYEPPGKEVGINLVSNNSGSPFSTIMVTECAFEEIYKITHGVIGLFAPGEIEKLKTTLIPKFEATKGIQKVGEIENPLLGTAEKDELKYGVHSAALESAIELEVKPKNPGEGFGIYH